MLGNLYNFCSKPVLFQEYTIRQAQDYIEGIRTVQNVQYNNFFNECRVTTLVEKSYN